MANEFLARAIQKLEVYQFDEAKYFYFYVGLQNCLQALKLFEKCEYEATKGIHMAPSFPGTLCCVQMRIFSGVMIECASNLDGIKCFVPIHCLE